MRTCSDTHEEVIYSGTECPVCKERLLLDQALDDREDIDQDNIANLSKEIELLEKRLAGIELLMGIHIVAKRWPWQPLRYAHVLPDSKQFEH